jgi:hypothetical protein
MIAPKRTGRPRAVEQLHIDGWLPPHINFDPESSAYDLVCRWRCYSHQGLHSEAQDALNRLRSLAARPLPGERFKVRRPR